MQLYNDILISEISIFEMRNKYFHIGYKFLLIRGFYTFYLLLSLTKPRLLRYAFKDICRNKLTLMMVLFGGIVMSNSLMFKTLFIFI
jgi:hypothetical protein